MVGHETGKSLDVLLRTGCGCLLLLQHVLCRRRMCFAKGNRDTFGGKGFPRARRGNRGTTNSAFTLADVVWRNVS